MLRANIRMIEDLSLLACQREDLLHAGSVGNIADHFRLRPRADLILHFHPHGLKIEAHLLENVDSDTLT